MTLTIHMVEIDNASHNVLGQREFSSADTTIFSVMPWPPDSNHPSIALPDGYHMIGFRFFYLENSITVYVSKGKVVANDPL